MQPALPNRCRWPHGKQFHLANTGEKRDNARGTDEGLERAPRSSLWRSSAMRS